MNAGNALKRSWERSWDYFGTEVGPDQPLSERERLPVAASHDTSRQPGSPQAFRDRPLLPPLTALAAAGAAEEPDRSRTQTLATGISAQSRGIRDDGSAMAKRPKQGYGQYHDLEEGLVIAQQAAGIHSTGLESSLNWAINSIESSIEVSKELHMDPSLPPINPSPPRSGSAVAENYTGRSHLGEHSPALAHQAKLPTYRNAEDFSSRVEERAVPDRPRQRTSLSSDLRTFAFPPPRQMSQSPYQPSSSPSAPFGGAPGPLRSPFISTTRTPSGFSLPSPSSLHFPTPNPPPGNLASVGASSSPPTDVSSRLTAPAHEIHLQDLQHQISQKTLALITLQREHDTLLSAYSRQQTRCITLDKKTQVSDNEINTLTEEKLRLQAQVESLDAQVEDLVRAKDEAHKQSVANSQQYMQIMAMSGKLQAKSAEEAKKWKAEREELEQEKVELMEKIKLLEEYGENTTNVKDISEMNIGSDEVLSLPPNAILDITDPPMLRAEIRKLRGTIQEHEATIRQIKAETDEINRVTDSLVGIRNRLSHATIVATGQAGPS